MTDVNHLADVLARSWINGNRQHVLTEIKANDSAGPRGDLNLAASIAIRLMNLETGLRKDNTETFLSYLALLDAPKKPKGEPAKPRKFAVMVGRNVGYHGSFEIEAYSAADAINQLDEIDLDAAVTDGDGWKEEIDQQPSRAFAVQDSKGGQITHL